MAGNMGPIGVAAHSEKYGSRKYVLSFTVEPGALEVSKMWNSCKKNELKQSRTGGKKISPGATSSPHQLRLMIR